MERDGGRRGSCFFLELERRARIYKRVVILVTRTLCTCIFVRLRCEANLMGKFKREES